MNIQVKAPVVANIRHFEVAGKVAQVLALTTKVETAAAYDSKLRAMTGGKLELIPGSLQNVTNGNHTPAVRFFVRPVTESREYEAASAMREVVTANVFKDEDDAIWSVVEAGGVKRLVKQTVTDIAALLADAARTNHNLIAASNYNTNGLEGFRNGNFVVFANAETGDLDAGVAVRGDDGVLSVAAMDADAILAIDDATVVANSQFAAATDEDDAADIIEMASSIASLQSELAADGYQPLDSGNKSAVLAFYQKLYGQSPTFWTAMRAMITNTFKLA